MKPVMHVMVGVLRDRCGRILVNQRPAGKPHAGRWEFPGGKLENGESPEAGLRRELHEELGIVAGPMQRLVEIRHAYPHFSVRLDVREVLHFGGSPRPRESQALKWVAPSDLPSEDILEADRSIVHALRLPEYLAITPDASLCERDDFLESLHDTLASGIRLVQLRSKSLSQDDFVVLAAQALSICREHGAQLVLNAAPGLLKIVPADGVHLDARRLHALHHRPVPETTWLSASCHSIYDLRKAEALSVDFALIGSVKQTLTHPQAQPLGWAGFRAIVENSNLPVYALGGMSGDDLVRARICGARGVAAIRGFWRE